MTCFTRPTRAGAGGNLSCSSAPSWTIDLEHTAGSFARLGPSLCLLPSHYMASEQDARSNAPQEHSGGGILAASFGIVRIREDRTTRTLRCLLLAQESGGWRCWDLDADSSFSAVALASDDNVAVTSLCCVQKLVESEAYVEAPHFCIVSAEEEGRSTLRCFSLAEGRYTVQLHLSRVLAVRATERCVVVGLEDGITGERRALSAGRPRRESLLADSPSAQASTPATAPLSSPPSPPPPRCAPSLWPCPTAGSPLPPRTRPRPLPPTALESSLLPRPPWLPASSAPAAASQCLA